jgi:hypothetical protein
MWTYPKRTDARLNVRQNLTLKPLQVQERQHEYGENENDFDQARYDEADCHGLAASSS